jgi:hypothetical protein
MRRTIDDQQLELFRARPGDMALRDAQDLMSWPFFSLAKTRRVQPIDFRMGEVSIRVEATPEHGMATIWDADVLIWAASQIVDARTYRRRFVTRFVLNRCTTRTVIARETAAALADHDPPMLRQRIGQRVAFADAAKTGRLVWEVGAANSAVRDVNGFANEVGRIAR